MANQDLKKGLSVVMPVYNEAGVVKLVVESLLEVLDGLNQPVELIVVDDGSTDGTKEVLDVFSGRINVFRHLVNRGYGAALKTGIRKAHYPLVAITDADGTYPNEKLPRLLDAMEAYDMVVGARTGGKVHAPFIGVQPSGCSNRLQAIWRTRRSRISTQGFECFAKIL